MTNHAQLRRVEEQQTGIAKKVLAATPAQDAWTPNQIASELYRLSGSRADLSTVSGCLNSLVDVGLVKRVSSTAGTYQRILVEAETPETALGMALVDAGISADPAKVQTRIQVQSSDPLARLGALADRLRNLGDLQKLLADEIDEMALEVVEQIRAAGAGNEKLKQFAALIREIQP